MGDGDGGTFPADQGALAGRLEGFEAWFGARHADWDRGAIAELAALVRHRVGNAALLPKLIDALVAEGLAAGWEAKRVASLHVLGHAMVEYHRLSATAAAPPARAPADRKLAEAAPRAAAEVAARARPLIGKLQAWCTEHVGLVRAMSTKGMAIIALNLCVIAFFVLLAYIVLTQSRASDWENQQDYYLVVGGLFFLVAFFVGLLVYQWRMYARALAVALAEPTSLLDLVEVPSLALELGGWRYGVAGDRPLGRLAIHTTQLRFEADVRTGPAGVKTERGAYAFDLARAQVTAIEVDLLAGTVHVRCGGTAWFLRVDISAREPLVAALRQAGYPLALG